MRYIFRPGVRITLAWVSGGATFVSALLLILAVISVDPPIFETAKGPGGDILIFLTLGWFVSGILAKLYMVDAAEAEGRRSRLGLVSAVISGASLVFWVGMWAFIFWATKGDLSGGVGDLSFFGKTLFYAFKFSMPPVDLYNVAYWTLKGRVLLRSS